MVDKQWKTSTPIFINVSKRGKTNAVQSRYFIEGKIDNTTPYRGEQVTLTYTLYTRVDVTGFEEELPRFKGLWTEELFSPKQLQLREVRKNGQTYHAATIKKLALFPTRSGKIEIEPMMATIAIRERRRNDFSIFGSPSEKYSLSTDSQVLSVKPLPEIKKGKSSAVVGQWNLSASINQASVKQDEALTIKIKLKGHGNLKSVDILPYKFPEDVEVFEPKVMVKKNNSQRLIGGEKIIEYVIIPRKSGKLKLLPFELVYFDPHQDKWLTKRTKPFIINVNKNERSGNAPIGLSKEEVHLMGQDIRFMDESEPNWQKQDSNVVNRTTMILSLLTGLIFIVPGIININRDRILNAADSRRARRALKNAMNILPNGAGNAEEIYRYIHQAVISFINDKKDQNVAEYSTADIVKSLSDHGISSENVDAIRIILMRGNTVRYAPLSQEDTTTDLNQIRQLLKEADNDWV